MGFGGGLGSLVVVEAEEVWSNLGFCRSTGRAVGFPALIVQLRL